MLIPVHGKHGVDPLQRFGVFLFPEKLFGFPDIDLVFLFLPDLFPDGMDPAQFHMGEHGQIRNPDPQDITAVPALFGHKARAEGPLSADVFCQERRSGCAVPVNDPAAVSVPVPARTEEILRFPVRIQGTVHGARIVRRRDEKLSVLFPEVLYHAPAEL